MPTASFYRGYLDRLPVGPSAADADLHLLNEGERAQLRRITRWSMVLGFSISLVCNSSLFLPLYAYPHLFPIIGLPIPGLGTVARLEWGPWLWMALWIFVEITLLVLLNLTGVHAVAVATGYLTRANKAERSESVLRMALNTPARELATYGIDPFQGVNRYSLIIFNFILQMKGVIAHQFLRLLLVRFLGRLALRAVLDFSGVPIYGTLNALGARAILREARVLIMGEMIIERLGPQLPDLAPSSLRDNLIYDTLQFIAIHKRDFHRNHYLLTGLLLKRYAIEPRDAHRVSDDYSSRLAAAPDDLRSLCTLVLILGLLLDGRISWRERARIPQLSRMGLLAEQREELQTWADDFVEGRGLDAVVTRYLPVASLY
ncbi:MAG: hypothetical protein HGA45_09285 [Chloroflexales bacterium]|nr:hypothetical protein [Chloroflexales bacterium]